MTTDVRRNHRSHECRGSCSQSMAIIPSALLILLLSLFSCEREKSSSIPLFPFSYPEQKGSLFLLTMNSAGFFLFSLSPLCSFSVISFFVIFPPSLSSCFDCRERQQAVRGMRLDSVLFLFAILSGYSLLLLLFSSGSRRIL